MKGIVLVLALALLSSLLFAQAEPAGPLADPDPAGPAAQAAGNVYGYQNMYLYWWTMRQEELPESQNRFARHARLGDPNMDPEALQAREEPQRFQAQSGDCASDCDGEPDRDRTREQLQDGSCEDGRDGPDQDRTRSGR